MTDLTREGLMFDDPDLTGDALLFALTLSHVLTRRKHDKTYRLRTGTTAKVLKEVRRLAHGDSTHWRWIKKVIADDVPRYAIDPPRALRCGAPMIRRDGPCGKSTSTRWIDRDPTTGEQEWIGFCSRHYTAQQDILRRERLADWVAHGRPEPAPNRGGVLPRYFDTDWPKWWAWAAPYRTPSQGGREATPPRPMLTLIQGGQGSWMVQ